MSKPRGRTLRPEYVQAVQLVHREIKRGRTKGEAMRKAMLLIPALKGNKDKRNRRLSKLYNDYLPLLLAQDEDKAGLNGDLICLPLEYELESDCKTFLDPKKLPLAVK